MPHSPKQHTADPVLAEMVSPGSATVPAPPPIVAQADTFVAEIVSPARPLAISRGRGLMRRISSAAEWLFGVLSMIAILSVLGALVVGFILIAIWKTTLIRALDNAYQRFGRAVGFGALTLFAAPLALLISMVLIVTIPAGLIGTLLYLIFLYLAKVFAGMFLGKWLFRLFGGRTASIWLTAPVGIILVYALCAVPFVGWLIWLFGAMVGFGVILELVGSSRRP